MYGLLVIVPVLVAGFMAGLSHMYPFCQCKKEVQDLWSSCHCESHIQYDTDTYEIVNLTKELLFESYKGEEEYYKRTLTDLYITKMAELKFVGSNFFEELPNLSYIRIEHTSVKALPTLSNLGRKEPMGIIDFGSNKIEFITTGNFAVRVDHLFFDNNKLMTIEDWAFNGSEVGKLSLRGNRELEGLSENVFNGLKSLRELDLSDTSIQILPAMGLEEVEILRIQNTFTLKTVPSIYDLKKLEKAWLTYSFHCCGFQFPAQHNSVRHREFMKEIEVACSNRPSYSNENVYNFPTDDSQFLSSLKGLEGGNERKTNNWLAGNSEQFHKVTALSPLFKIYANCGSITSRGPVECWPRADALNPCEDLMGWQWLRVGVWLVLTAAVLGNLAVLAVLATSTTEKSVPRFLMMNLAFADFCMAVYLLLLASMDLLARRAYFKYAFDWQRGAGCKISGFLTIFSCQLSLFSLCLLTVERWLAIRYALYTNRLDLNLAWKVMLVGWIYAILMAAFPLMGISSYSVSSICLPMGIDDTPSLLYIVVLLINSGLGFLLICFCYGQIYCSLSYETRSSNEGAIAHKIAILVGTNFICWAPIAFFSLTTVAGYPLITISQSKILLVFIYPINSCANPFLYAILTKQYRKDLLLILARYGVCVKLSQKYNEVYSRPTSNVTPHQPPPNESLL